MIILKKTRKPKHFIAEYDLSTPNCIGMKYKCTRCKSKWKIEDNSEVNCIFQKISFSSTSTSCFINTKGIDAYERADSGWNIFCVCPVCSALNHKTLKAKYEWKELS